MEQTTDIITGEEIAKAWGNANFGNVEKRTVIANSLLKYACGYDTGRTAFCICNELGLVDAKKKLTDLGRRYLWAHYSNGNSF